MGPQLILHANFIDFEGEITWCEAAVGYDPSQPIGAVLNLATTFANKVGDCSGLVIRDISVSLRLWADLGLPGQPSGDMYPNAEDKAYLLFHSENSAGVSSIKIPGPHNDVFLSDRETVDPTYGPVRLLIEWIYENVVSQGGATGMRYQRGTLWRAPTRKKFRQGIPSERGG